jgi:hypothetical protein
MMGVIDFVYANFQMRANSVAMRDAAYFKSEGGEIAEPRTEGRRCHGEL